MVEKERGGINLVFVFQSKFIIICVYSKDMIEKVPKSFTSPAPSHTALNSSTKRPGENQPKISSELHILEIGNRIFYYVNLLYSL